MKNTLNLLKNNLFSKKELLKNILDDKGGVKYQVTMSNQW